MTKRDAIVVLLQRADGLLDCWKMTRRGDCFDSDCPPCLVSTEIREVLADLLVGNRVEGVE